ncbi:hypothetical protein Ancab_008597 [Ancistrocladus abbreviatus]
MGMVRGTALCYLGMGVANRDAFEWHPRHSTSFCADIKLGLCDLLVEPPRKRAVRHHRSLPLPGCASPRRTSDEWCVSGDWEFYVSYLALLESHIGEE